MSHLTLEALARLVDEPAADAEEAHLGVCPSCREELEGLRGQTAAMADLPKMIPAPDAWPALRQRLRAERLLGAPSRRAVAATRAAAAVLLFLAGGAVGYAARGAPADAASVAAAQPGPASGEAAREADAAASPGAAREPVGDGSDPSGVAGPALAGAAGAGGAADLVQVEAAQEAFFAALDRYMAASGTAPADPATRLAALDNIVLTTAEALNEAPADPVINSYYLTAVAQRNAVLRQIAATFGAEPVF